MEKASYSRHSQSQKEKGKADAHYKKQSIYHHLSPVIMNFPILASHTCSTGQIADIKRKKRKHAGRKKANESLKKHCHCRYTYIKLKSHRVCIPRLSIIPYFSVYSRFLLTFPAVYHINSKTHQYQSCQGIPGKGLSAFSQKYRRKQNAKHRIHKSKNCHTADWIIL